MTLKGKLIIAGAGILTVALVASHIGVYYKGWNDAEKAAVPTGLDKDPIVKPVEGKPATISVTGLMYYEDALTFKMFSTGAGAGEAWIRRPERWKERVRYNLILIGLGGGYHAGSWLPTGSLDYLRRVGAFKGVEFFIGPGLSVSALNERPVSEHIAVNIRLSAAALWY